MSQQQQHAPGGHYSGHNPIPTVKQFVENLDRDKKERDAKLDEEATAAKQAEKQQKKAKSPASPTKSGLEDHHPTENAAKGTEKTVTDPTTGREVVIADVNKEMMKEAENPHLVIPNANLGKDTVSETQHGHIHS